MYNAFVTQSSSQQFMNVEHTDLGLVAGYRFYRELHLCSFENSILLQDILLRLVMAKRLKHKEKTFF